jgi:hypothetical protein
MHIMRSCLCAEEGNGGGFADTGGAQIEKQAARAEASRDLLLFHHRYEASKSENRVGKHRRRRESMEASGRESRAGGRRERGDSGLRNLGRGRFFRAISSAPRGASRVASRPRPHLFRSL